MEFPELFRPVNHIICYKNLTNTCTNENEKEFERNGKDDGLERAIKLLASNGHFFFAIELNHRMGNWTQSLFNGNNGLHGLNSQIIADSYSNL